MRRQILRGGVLLSIGQSASLALSFVRNLVIARLVGPENMGIAAGFAATMTALELTSDLGVQKVVIQDDDADQPGFLGTAHSIVCLRSLIPSIGLFVLARPFAAWFDAEPATWAFQMLALTPLIRALTHLDVYRRHRHLDYRTLIQAEVCSHAAGLAAGGLAAWIWRDYTAVLVAILTQATILAAVSHVVATVPYEWCWSKSFARRMLSYGWPLVINGLLMFLGVHSDRFIISRGFGLEILGIFAVASTLAVVPTHALNRILNPLLLPLLSASKSDRDLLRAQYRKAAHMTATLAVFLVAVLAMVAPDGVTFLYGSDYSRASQWMGLLALIQAVRLVRLVPTQAALALGATRVIMWSNVVRAAAIPLVAAAAFTGSSLDSVLLYFCLAELSALAFSAAALQVTTPVRAVDLFGPAALPTMLIVVLILIDTVIGMQLSLLLRVAVASIVIAVSFFALLPAERTSARFRFVRRLRSP